MSESMDIRSSFVVLWNWARRYAKVALLTALFLTGRAYASGFPGFSFDIIATLSYLQTLLAHLGPMLSAVLFIIAGIFYAVGQLLPATKRAAFHATTVDILMGAIIVAVLSVASNGLALASTQLLTNITSNALV
jgi:hypothetical protein